jgi:hypothetical protein
MNELRTEKLIQDWIYDAKVLLQCHLAKASFAKRLNRNIGLCSAVLSAIVASSIFASINSNPHTVIKIAAGLVSISATVLMSIISFLKLAETAQQHQNSGNEYASIRKELELLQTHPTMESDSFLEQMRGIKQRWDTVRKDSIPIDPEYMKKFRKRPLVPNAVRGLEKAIASTGR